MGRGRGRGRVGVTWAVELPSLTILSPVVGHKGIAPPPRQVLNDADTFAGVGVKENDFLVYMAKPKVRGTRGGVSTQSLRHTHTRVCLVS